jgi:hypothetical protein
LNRRYERVKEGYKTKYGADKEGKSGNFDCLSLTNSFASIIFPVNTQFAARKALEVAAIAKGGGGKGWPQDTKIRTEEKEVTEK